MKHLAGIYLYGISCGKHWKEFVKEYGIKDVRTKYWSINRGTTKEDRRLFARGFKISLC